MKKLKKVKVIKLGTACIDKATELQGTLTHWTCDMSGYINYLFQPKALDEEGQPVPQLYLEAERLNVKPEDFEEIEIPSFNILGTIVEDEASGFKGMAVSFLRHINGCFHIIIQPKGLNPKNNSPVRKNDFDIRSCKGEMIEKLTPKKLDETKKETPSPSSIHSNFEPTPKKLSVQ